MRKIVKPVVRRECPPVVVSGITHKSGLITMVVTLRLRESGAFQQFKKFCRLKCTNIGWEQVDEDRPIFVCSGHPDALMELARKWFTKEWHWDANAVVMGGRTKLTPVKRKTLHVMVKAVKVRIEHDEEGNVTLVSHTDKYEAEVQAKQRPILHGDEVRDRIDEQKRAEKYKEDKEYYGRMGLSPPNE